MEYKRIIQQSLDYIEDNLRAEITAAELAEKAGFSLYHYYRMFQSATGMPVMQYVLRRRLLHAIYGIYCGSTGIDAALTYGFDTYAGFYKAFRREFGCTPSAFLRSCQAKKPYRIELTKEEHIMITHKKAAEILKHWNLEKIVISDIYYEGTGNKNDNAYYVGEDYVLKFTANLGKLKNNITLSKEIEKAGLCAAVPIATNNGKEYMQEGEVYFCLTRRLPGKQLSTAALYESNSLECARLIGEKIGKLHTALRGVDVPIRDTDIYKNVKEWALPKAKEILNLKDVFCQEYIKNLERLHDKLPRQLIHRDPNPGNIICSEDKEKEWSFIDFELSERNVRIYDPCYAATAILLEGFEKYREKWFEIYRYIMKGYDSAAGMTEEERKAVPYILFANQLICVAYFAEQEKLAAVFEINKRMTCWLAEHFNLLYLEK